MELKLWHIDIKTSIKYFVQSMLTVSEGNVGTLLLTVYYLCYL